MRRRGRLLPLLVALCAAAVPAAAVQPDEVLADRGLEGRARSISEELRCLVCQNQSIDDSDAPLAHDLRVLVRDRLKLGDSDEAVRRYVVSRYGEYVLLRPVFAWHTLLLWFGPALLLLAGLAGALAVRRSSGAGEAPPLSAAERSRLGEVLARDGG